MKLKYILILAVLALVGIMGCTEDDASNPTGPSVQTGFWVADTNNSAFNNAYMIDPSNANDMDSSIVVKFTPNRTAKLTKFRVMFPTEDSGKTYVPVVVSYHTSETGAPAHTFTISSASIVRNSATGFAWTEVSVAATNINTTSGTSFYLHVTPQFTARPNPGTNQVFEIRCKLDTDNTNPDTKLLSRGGVISNATYMNGSTPSTWDAAVSVAYEY